MEFPRFPPQKQAQVQHLVSHALLMGLDGADLVSIGRRLVRVQQRLQLLELRRWWKNLNPRVFGPDDPHMIHSFVFDSNGVGYAVTKSPFIYRVLITNPVTATMKGYGVGHERIPGATRTERWRLSVAQQLRQGAITLDF